MRRRWICAVVVIVGVSCASAAPPASEGSVSTVQVARVDLVEAGIRAVTGPVRLLFVRTKLCEGVGDGTTGRCTSTLTEDEIASLATRLSDLSDDVRFVAAYEAIPAGQAPIDQSGRDYVFVSPPQEHGDGTYWIEGGETCGGLCGRGGTYVLEEKDTVRGRRPGTHRHRVVDLLSPGIVHRTSRTGDPFKVEYDGVLVVRFAPDGRCSEHPEWYFRRELQG